MKKKSVIRRKLQVYPISEFHEAMNRERSRTDRNGYSFSLILFDIRKEKRYSSTKKLLSTVSGRVRSVDLIGWFDDRHLSVLLPATALDGSQKLAKSVADTLKADSLMVDFSVFSYPAQKMEMQSIWQNVYSL